MAKICAPGALPDQPGPSAAWNFTSGRYGPSIRQQTPPTKSTWGSWTIPSPMLNGMRLPEWRRAWLSYCASQWVTNPNLDTTSFFDNSGLYDVYSIYGTHINPTPFNIYMWAAAGQWGPVAWRHYQSGTFYWDSLDLYCSPYPAANPPPGITAASLSAAMELSVTINPYTAGYWAQIYTSAPYQTIVSLPKLLCCGAFSNSLPPYTTFTVSSAQMLSLFRPFPPGSNVMVGVRMTEEFYCNNSPIAAELVQVGA